MSGVRVLVGTRKGAFVLTSDGKRQNVGRQRPALRGLGDLPPEGLARRPEPDLRVADQRLVRADHPALRRRRQDLAPAGDAARRADHDPRRHAQGREQQVRLRHLPGNRQAAHHAPVVRRHAAPLGVQARLAPRAVADRPRHRLRRRRGRRPLPLDRRRQDLARAGRPARPRAGLQVDARRRRHGPAHDPPRPDQPQAHLHRHLGRGRVPHRRRRQDLEADQPRAAVAVHPRPGRRGRPLRPPHRHAPVAAERAVHAEALGRHAHRRRRRDSGTRSAATCRPTSASRSTSTPTSRTRSTSCRSRATRSTIRPRASCASTAAARAATSGSR